jgi:hypothetical protein
MKHKKWAMLKIVEGLLAFSLCTAYHASRKGQCYVATYHYVCRNSSVAFHACGYIACAFGTVGMVHVL